MTPAPGDRLVRHVGDRARFVLENRNGRTPPGWRARLRTNLGRAIVMRQEIILARARGVSPAGAAWRDLPMTEEGDHWVLELPLAEVGYFKAKAYLLDPNGWQHWPEGPDAGICVHPDAARTANTLYCAFPRLFGATRTASGASRERVEDQLRRLEEQGHTIIPPSGKMRDLLACLPHIVEELGCRILHLLPVNPAPTTYARFGRFGSPYAALDLTAIDPALVVLDKRTTGVDQFRELTYGMHSRGGRVFLDIAINHTGWGSTLQENHPQWFLRDRDGRFVSPGAWGVTWEDLIELRHDNAALWEKLAEMVLVWCRRGVDGFRCDAGYKVPVPAWQYIVARVQQEFPETIFLLEGLGGSWEITEALLTDGGMQWAYSELFQNHSGLQVAGYLDHSLRQSQRVGLLVHFSETHDNDRLAARSAAVVATATSSNPAPRNPAAPPARAWSLLRNRLCALTSVSGGFGFTCGVEWLATEKIDVHGSTGLAWQSRDNLVPELARLNRLLVEHPCFFDGATLTRLSPAASPVYALRRESAEGKDRVVVLVNIDVDVEQQWTLDDDPALDGASEWKVDLLGQSLPAMDSKIAGRLRITLPPGAAYCLAASTRPRGLAGDAYRAARARAAWALQALQVEFPDGNFGRFDWRELAALVERSLFDFLAAVQRFDRKNAEADLHAALATALGRSEYPRVIRWRLPDRRRITPIPPGHWLLIEDTVPFRASLRAGSGQEALNRTSLAVAAGHVACFPPRQEAADAQLALERYAEADSQIEATIRFLAAEPALLCSGTPSPNADALVLLTNGIGGMARLGADPGRVQSKYDCVLGANLNSSVPVDRHIFVKRIRVWVNADGFISPLDALNLDSFSPGPPASWEFVAGAGDSRSVLIRLMADMLDGHNTTVFHFTARRLQREPGGAAAASRTADDMDVRLTVRFDLEDRNFHTETHHNGGADFHFSSHTRTLPDVIGFAFTPAVDRQLFVYADKGAYHPAAEWSHNIPHPKEQSRGQIAAGDAFSPGWFELPMPDDAPAKLVLSACAENFESLRPKLSPAVEQFVGAREAANRTALELAGFSANDLFGRQLALAAQAFVVRRGNGKTVIAGYPWFLDWGRDTFICARGLLAAGMTEEVRQILMTFARFEKDGTLPNSISGEDASDRDTSDAPLWFGIVCEEVATRDGPKFYETVVDQTGRTLRQVLQSIAAHYADGTPNGIRLDRDSALIWSPGHFTWMDTNHPAGTPREGYPIEIQALWIRLLRQLAGLGSPAEGKRWSELADRALMSLEELFWLEEPGWYADVLFAKAEQPAAKATASDALRSNALFPVSLGLVGGGRARRCVEAALRHLVVPGALRSLAPLPVKVPLPVYDREGRLLNDPANPYWAQYEGDEDTRRKPAYHNGTAWTWTFPVFCEALARAWDFAPEAVTAARAYLGSMDRIIAEGCIGQVPEVLDGDAPHTQRGCDAQAWGVTEALRVWKLLETKG